MNGNTPSGFAVNGAAPAGSNNELVTRAEFVQLVRALAADRRDKPGEWENSDLPAYLEALAAWVEDMDGYFQGRGEPVPEQPTWKTLGQILRAAKVYE